MTTLRIIVCLGLLAAGFVAPTNAGESEPTVALVWSAEPELLEHTGLRVLQVYSAFALVEGHESTLASLADRFLIEPVSRVLEKGSLAHDTRNGEPSLPAGLRAAPDDPHLVVQFIGPVRPAWRTWLSERALILDYVPSNAFIVSAPGVAPSTLEAAPFVAYAGPYHLAYRLHPSLAAGIEALDVQLWRNADPAGPRSLAERLGGQILLESAGPAETYLRLRLPSGSLLEFARHPDVAWIQPTGTVSLDNERATSLVQSGIPGNPVLQPIVGRSVHAHGVTGEGQVVAVADGGIDSANGRFVHEMFDDPDHGPFLFGEANPDHRKVLAYLPLVEDGIVRGDFVGMDHGVHTSGTATGDAPENGAYDTYNLHDGMAYGAKLVFMDLQIANGGFNEPIDYANVFDPPYSLGARVHSNSYGFDEPLDASYDLHARQNDLFHESHPDFLAVRSMGNFGDNRMRPEAVAKNVISAGFTDNIDGQSVYGYSSRGPTMDGRVKPTLVAPGQLTSGITGNRYAAKLGTSMSTPLLAGSAALVREYFTDGWYPTGAPVAEDGFNPSSALVRAVLINSAVPIGGLNTGSAGLGGDPTGLPPSCAEDICAHEPVKANWPNADMGWGEPRLDRALAFAGDPVGLWVRDGDALATGETLEFEVLVVDSALGLKVSLAWTDPAAAAGANPALVNDLDLVVVTPAGVELKGNVFAAPGTGAATGPLNEEANDAIGEDAIKGGGAIILSGDGPLPSGTFTHPESVPGGPADRRNVEEQVVLNAPAPGTYVIRVLGANVPTGTQAASIVASGGVASGLPTGGAS